jgi:uncharacterized membrane protein
MLIPRLGSDHGELPRLALAVARLSAVGFSLVLCAQLFWMQLAPRSSYALSNVLGAPGRNLLLLTLGAGIVMPALASLLLFWRKGASVLEQLSYWATVLAPLSLAFVLPGLFLSQVAETKPLFYLVVLSAFGLATRALVAASLRAQSARRVARSSMPAQRPSRLQRLRSRVAAWQRPEAAALAFVLLLAIGYAAYFGHYAIVHHRMIQTIDTDVGIADNLMANLQRGRWFRAPAQFGTLPGNYLGVHADYIALLFVPIYRLRPGPETLLWLQAALAALSSVPLFLLGSRLLGQRVGVWASIAYLLAAPLHVALVYGFSWFPAFGLFSFTLYYALVSERRWLIALALPALLASTEAGPLAVFALGIFFSVSRRKTRLGVGLCLVAALVFAINTRLALRTSEQAELPPLAVGLKTLLHNPIYFFLDLARATKLAAALHALAPFALLSLAPLSSLALLLPGLLFTSASKEFWPTSVASAQFHLLWIPGCILAVLFSLHRFRTTPGQRPLFLASMIAMSLALLSHSYDFGLLLRADAMTNPGKSTQFGFTRSDAKRYADLQALIRLIPASASVVATTYMLSQVSSRTDVFDARRPYGKPDYVLFSTRELAGAARTALSTTLTSHSYALVAQREEFYLFRRAAETPETSAALRALGLLGADRP